MQCWINFGLKGTFPSNAGLDKISKHLFAPTILCINNSIDFYYDEFSILEIYNYCWLNSIGMLFVISLIKNSQIASINYELHIIARVYSFSYSNKRFFKICIINGDVDLSNYLRTSNILCYGLVSIYLHFSFELKFKSDY